MCGARVGDFQNGHRGLRCQLPDKLQFRIRERRHELILIQIGPLLSGTRGIKQAQLVVSEDVEEAIDGRVTIPHPK